MTRKIRRALDATLRSIEGDGEALVFVVTGDRATKTGRLERYELRLKACRYGVLQLQRALQAMHKRDRSRIENESRRITREIAALTEEPPP